MKVKNVSRQELVVGGWLPGKGRAPGGSERCSRGATTPRRSTLRYVGRVGTGFNDEELERLAGCAPLRREDSAPSPSGPAPPREAVFVRAGAGRRGRVPRMDRRRQPAPPSYLGLRDDKARARWCERTMSSRAAGEQGDDGEQARSAPATASKARPRAAPELVHETKRAAERDRAGRRARAETDEPRASSSTREAGFSKRDLIDYYASVAPAILGHLPTAR